DRAAHRRSDGQGRAARSHRLHRDAAGARQQDLHGSRRGQAHGRQREVDQPGEGRLFAGCERPAVARQAAGSTEACPAGRRSWVNDCQRVETMIANSEERTAALFVAMAAGILLNATADIGLKANEPARLVGVSTEGDAVLIESSEPAAYSVSRPNPMTLVVDM